jgi:hypothetical protein
MVLPHGNIIPSVGVIAPNFEPERGRSLIEIKENRRAALLQRKSNLIHLSRTGRLALRES